MSVVPAILGGQIAQSAQDFLATGLAQFLTMVRDMLLYAMSLGKWIITALGKHPLASLLLIENMAILIS